jgi:hypothetical protein
LSEIRRRPSLARTRDEGKRELVHGFFHVGQSVLAR